MKLPIITEINSLDEFKEILGRNDKKITIVKMGATWCQPCKRIEPLVYRWIDKLPDNVQMCLIDIDVSFQMYSFLKSKRIVNGVPALLCYDKKGSLFNAIPDDVVVGSDINQVNLFFDRCIRKAET
jgi:thiol-disulfide isomerase/thioredoxin